MKLHALDVTAFGPFVGTERVDFDALNDAGLFLLAGPTGAGKTSILDAVCFALYGVVPGVRGVKALKSQHADPLTKPEVILEFSVRERRFRLRRSPEWTRPKKRGEGTRTEPAAASLIELTGGMEEFRSSRAAEVGLMVGELIGMKAAQFQQVAMLPQGDFQRFLHASTEDRHDVLQQLFQTDRFARIEEWVQDHSRTLSRQADERESVVRQLAHTLAERAEVEPLVAGDAATDAAPGTLPHGDALLEWARSLLSTAEAELDTLRAAADGATDELTAARERVDALRLVAAAVSRRDDAQRQLAALESTRAEAARAGDALAADARAAACLPVIDLLERAEADLASAGESWADAVERLHRLPDLDLPDAPALPDLTQAEDDARTAIAQAEALLPRAEAVRSALADLSTTEGLLEKTRAELVSAVARRDALPEQLATVRADLEAATSLAGRREALELKLADAVERSEAARAVPDAEAALTLAQDIVRDRRDAAADARDVVQTLHARRLAGAAAELAGELVPGEACAVCGSTDHPHPAPADAGRVSADEQEHAQRVFDEAQEALVAATRDATTAERRLESLRTRADGRTVDGAIADVAALTVELAAAKEAGDHRDALTGQLAALERSLAEASDAAVALETSIAGLTQRVASQQESLEADQAEIAAVLGPVDPCTIPDLAHRRRTDASAVAEAIRSWESQDSARRRSADVEAQARSTCVAHGFADVLEARAATLTPEARQDLEAVLTERAALEAGARAVLAETAVVAVADAASPDLATVEADLLARETAAQSAAREFHLQEQRVTSLRSLTDRLSEALTAWAPLRAEHLRAAGMARLVRGMGHDNHLQMRLSSYVLATRLDQVLDAANERLSHMRDQRYLLQRTGRASRKGSQAGLGLEVVDQWTGDVRDPTTLSGGETFVVSLALALGLADVVTQEAGGTEIETLFVDEGFGTLDADTLDDVMDRLDGLRAGGRTVGVVSHVSELRTRIPTQVHVRKTPRGSSIHAETLVG